MFDKAPEPHSDGSYEPEEGRVGPEDERIALRCNRKELQLVDSFVASGEFRTRSELMRAALRDFLRARALSAIAPTGEPAGLIEVPVRLRRDELETLVAHAKLVGNDRPMGDLLAELVRRGEMEAKISELVHRHRLSVQQWEETRETVAALERTGRRLAGRGVVGR
ncbi:MAG TPA: ribbon-helix-helix domain-containing protein [Thermoplasmata archaeon]|nr:ribbon-helix-helix domain-containing protein [Thermoplasmata archaeon]